MSHRIQERIADEAELGKRSSESDTATPRPVPRRPPSQLVTRHRQQAAAPVSGSADVSACRQRLPTIATRLSRHCGWNWDLALYGRWTSGTPAGLQAAWTRGKAANCATTTSAPPSIPLDRIVCLPFCLRIDRVLCFRHRRRYDTDVVTLAVERTQQIVQRCLGTHVFVGTYAFDSPRMRAALLSLQTVSLPCWPSMLPPSRSRPGH